MTTSRPAPLFTLARTVPAPARAAPRHARRRRIGSSTRTAIRSAAFVVLAGMAIMALVGGPGGSASADDTGTTWVGQREHDRALPMVGPPDAGIAELLSTLDSGPHWEGAATASR